MCNEKINGKQDLDEAKPCGAKISKVHKPWHIAQFLMNFSEPGAGTIFNGCYCHADGNEKNCVIGNIVLGLCQYIGAICILGWIHSMQFGVGIYRRGE